MIPDASVRMGLAKARNQQKHGVSFEDAMHVFEDGFALFERDQNSESEEPGWRALGSAGSFAVLLVAHTIRDDGGNDVIRLISARRATRKERRRYEETRDQNFGEQSPDTGEEAKALPPGR